MSDSHRIPKMNDTTHTDDDTERTEGERSLAAMLDINWNTNWSTIPPEAEQHTEQAYIHLRKAMDIVEDERESENSTEGD